MKLGLFFMPLTRPGQEIGEDVEELVARFAEAEHQPALGARGGIERIGDARDGCLHRRRPCGIDGGPDRLADLHQRVRDVKQGPDGLLYVLTDEVKGAILRIEPAK